MLNKTMIAIMVAAGMMLCGCSVMDVLDSSEIAAVTSETSETSIVIKVPQDDGVIRRTESINGNYIEYNREQGVCILHVDHTRINGGNTYYDGRSLRQDIVHERVEHPGQVIPVL